ncbi:MAG: hypothetical protein KC662_04815 [Candidatus Magasanikbacteria bacterium]|nr:hypothetical protein [Candidatus Magasanikbacteria bacterium]
MTVLIFGTDQIFLGEFTFEDGALRQSILSTKGEEILGPYVSRWMTRGIPMTRGFVSDKKSHSEISYQEFIQPRDHEAIMAAYRWFQDHQLFALDLVESLIPYWQRLLRLPFEPQERLAIMLAIRATYRESLEEWNICFDEVERAHSIELEAYEKAKAKATKKAAQAIAHGLKK